MTRLSATERAPGWMNCTVSPEAMLKLCQLMMALLPNWVMLVVLPFCWIAALPATTLPPMGAASSGCAVIMTANDPATNDRTSLSNAPSLRYPPCQPPRSALRLALHHQSASRSVVMVGDQDSNGGDAVWMSSTGRRKTPAGAGRCPGERIGQKKKGL